VAVTDFCGDRNFKDHVLNAYIYLMNEYRYAVSPLLAHLFQKLILPAVMATESSSLGSVAVLTPLERWRECLPRCVFFGYMRYDTDRQRRLDSCRKAISLKSPCESLLGKYFLVRC
jgi:hypothetical protein